MRPKRRIGVMGGTFDPIHLGHLVAASEVAVRCTLDEVVFVPTGRPWQKPKRAATDAEHRYLMTELATENDERFRVSRVDIDRPGPTYAVDTLRDLSHIYGEATTLCFIIGADALAQIRTWRDHEEVLTRAAVIGVPRPGHALADDLLRELRMPASVSIVDVPALAISSTDIRRRVAAGLPIRYLVTEAVDRYISKTNLYRDVR